MKYRVKEIKNDSFLDGLMTLIFFWLIPFMNTGPTWEIQYKKHWWNRWKTCDNTDNIAEAYSSWLNYSIDGKYTLPMNLKFPHNHIEGKFTWCKLKVGKFPDNKKYQEGQYYAGYKPENYHNFYYCSYGNSYEEAISKLWGDIEVQKMIHRI